MQDFFFKKGSYWIFQNDSTKTLDSLYITNTETGCEAVYLSQGYGQNWEYYQISYFSYPYGLRYYDMIQYDMMQRNRHPSTSPSIQGWIVYSSNISTGFQYFPVVIGSMTINGKTFLNVQLSHDLFHASERVDTYTAKGVGIIRRIVYSGNTKGEWNLIRSKIIK